MAIIKCKMCGGDLEVDSGVSVAECEFCGTKQTLPKVNEEVIQNLFNRANVLRLKCEFDKAEQIYEKILQENNAEAEAHWGIVLCKYGIEYVEDPKTYKRIPTCHRTSYDAVTADADYLAAIEHADAVQRNIYEAEAKAIDKIQKNILSIVKDEKPFDVFICYKETDENGKRTIDSAIANDIYYQLTQEGLKVFYAAITLEDKLGQEYEPYIFAALNSAKVMLVIGTKPQNFTAVWVKNEWSRFLKLMKTDRSKLLIPCYKDMDAYELPEEFAHLQAQDMGKIGFINDIVRGIKKVSVKETVKSVAAVETAAPAGNANTAPLLKRVFMFLEDGDWNSANEYCEKVLDIDPECAEAYLGKLMAELFVRKQDALKDEKEPFDGNGNYQKAVRFGDEKLQKMLTNCTQHIKTRNENVRLESAYSKACRTMLMAENEQEFMEAARLFEKVSGYKDAAERAKECCEKAESDRIERERLDALEREARERTAKRNKKIAAIGVAVIAVIVSVTLLINNIIIPNGKYNDAIKLMDAGKFDEAYDIFTELGDYRDAVDKARITITKAQFNNIKVGDYIKFGAYEQDSDTSNGKEEIEWLVLEVKDGKALVISKYALDCKPYNESYTEVTWETCTLRSWLNNDFINAAFSAVEKTMIPTVTVSVDKNPDNYSDAIGGAGTTQPSLPAGQGVACESLSLSQKTIEFMNVGITWTLQVRPTPANTTDAITFESSAPEVVTIDENGLLTAVGAGQATIRVTCGAVSETCVIKCSFENPPTELNTNPTDPTDPTATNITQDQVFLLSITEVNKYFSSDAQDDIISSEPIYSSRQCEATDYAVVNGVYDIGGTCSWWMRSPFIYQDVAAVVDWAGGIDGGCAVIVECAVRPAMWIDFE